MIEIQRVAQEPTIEVTATLRMSEAELRALDVLSRWSSKAVSTTLRVHVIGSHGGPGFEAGIESLMELAKREIAPILQRTDAAREAFKEKA